MIELQDVTKYYPTRSGRHYVLQDVSIVFPSNLSIGILGRNGTGKSTLLNLLGGIDYPNKGRIISEDSISWPMGLASGLQASLTGKDSAKFVCRIYGQDEHEVREKVAFVHEFSELGDYFYEPVKSYSSGMRSRLTFAMSMAFDFDYYLMDEITAVGDPQFKEKAAEALNDRAERSNVIYVSHNLNELRRLCDIGVFIEDKKLIMFDDVDDAIDVYQEKLKAEKETDV